MSTGSSMLWLYSKKITTHRIVYHSNSSATADSAVKSAHLKNYHSWKFPGEDPVLEDNLYLRINVFSSTVTAGTTFWFLNCHIFECKSTRMLQIYRKIPVWGEKHPCGAFGPTIRESKNFSSCFFLLSCCVQRAQRAEIFVFPCDFSPETVSGRS